MGDLGGEGRCGVEWCCTVCCEVVRGGVWVGASTEESDAARENLLEALLDDSHV